MTSDPLTDNNANPLCQRTDDEIRNRARELHHKEWQVEIAADAEVIRPSSDGECADRRVDLRWSRRLTKAASKLVGAAAMIALATRRGRSAERGVVGSGWSGNAAWTAYSLRAPIRDDRMKIPT